MLTLIRIATKVSLIVTVLGFLVVAAAYAADDLDERLARIGFATRTDAVAVVMGRPADATETTVTLGITRTKQRWLSGGHVVSIYSINGVTVMTRSCVGSMPDC